MPKLKDRHDRSPEEALRRLYEISYSVGEGYALSTEFDSELATLAWGLLRYHVPHGKEIVGLLCDLSGRPELREALDA